MAQDPPGEDQPKRRTFKPDARPTRSRFEPIVGVLFSALEAAGVAVNDELLARLIPTMPSSELFATHLITR